MRNNKIVHWFVSGLFAAFMILSAVPDILRVPDAVTIFDHLGYPTYLLPFLGVAKVFCALTVLLPGFARLKEWAYAGLVFEMLGALYSHLSVGDGPTVWMFPVIGLTLAGLSYISGRSKSENGVHCLHANKINAATA